MKVAVNGYGTIGKRVAEAIRLQGDMELVGVSKANPDYEAILINKLGIGLYVPEESLKKFEDKGVKVKGTVEEMMRKSDAVVDATAEGTAQKYKALYQSMNKPAVFQGGEDADIADASFSALCNYDEAIGKKYVRVVSCNTTGILRMVCSMKGFGISSVNVDIIRRAADPREVKKGPINSITLDPVKVPSHHADDVKSVIHDLNIFTRAVVVPTTLMHIHQMTLRIKGKAERKDIIGSILNTPRILLLSPASGVKSTAEIIEIARDIGRKRSDLPEVIAFEDSIFLDEESVMITYAVHQESIVVPENIDAIRATQGKVSKMDSINMTDRSLGIKMGYLI